MLEDARSDSSCNDEEVIPSHDIVLAARSCIDSCPRDKDNENLLDDRAGEDITLLAFIFSLRWWRPKWL